MKLKLRLLVSTIIVGSLSADSHPLPNAFKAIDNGGVKHAIDAYSDGVGAVVVNNLMTVDNSAMNTLVYKYGSTAKSTNTKIMDEVIYGSGSTNPKDKALASKLAVDGATCSDGNPATTGETWLNGICQGGTNINGTSCYDSNVMTVNDVYNNGVCAGTLTVNGQTCNDNNTLTYGDKWLNGVCAGFTNGTTCNDGNAATYADKYTNGICAGVTNGTACNDGNSATINDVYTNGVCAGITLISGTASAGNVFGPNNAGYAASRAIDGSLSGGWASVYNTWGTFWQVQLTNPQIVTSIDLYSSMVDFDIVASNNGSTWTTLSSVRGRSSANNAYINHAFSNSTAYTYYRFNIITGNSGTPLTYINEVKLN